MAARSTFVWGLKRSGIHLIVDWLYANHGATAKATITADRSRPLSDGYVDPDAGVAFYNNVGRFHCRVFELGDLRPDDFESAADGHTATIFGIEDCALRFAPRVPNGADLATVLVLRDPLNNLASRLAAEVNRPGLSRVDEAYIDLYESYCSEFLGYTSLLSNKTVVSYNRFVHDRAYRDSLADGLGLPNLDVVSGVSEYGGGSSFSGTDGPSPTAALMTRYLQHPVPAALVDLLLARPAIVEICRTVFGFDLAEQARGA